VEGREREIPQVTVEPGPLRALLRHCFQRFFGAAGAILLLTNATTATATVYKEHICCRDRLRDAFVQYAMAWLSLGAKVQDQVRVVKIQDLKIRA